MTDPLIVDGKVVTFHYTLMSSDGELLDESGDEATPYLHGAGNLVPGLERQMAGKKVGAKFKTVIEPADGYGERDANGVVQVPRSVFPDDAPLEPGLAFATEEPDGEVRPFWIVAMDDSTVTIDRNHPLAGEHLHYDIHVVGIRDATEEELAHEHAHGASCCSHDH